MKPLSQSFLINLLSFLFFPSLSLAQYQVPSGLGDLPDDADQSLSWVCRSGDDAVLIEAKQDTAWQSITKQKGWSCQQGTPDVPTGALKFSCEPTNTDFLGNLTFTWLSGTDEQKLMGQWMHQLADEQAMICQMAKVELWDSEENTP